MTTSRVIGGASLGDFLSQPRGSILESRHAERDRGIGISHCTAPTFGQRRLLLGSVCAGHMVECRRHTTQGVEHAQSPAILAAALMDREVERDILLRMGLTDSMAEACLTHNVTRDEQLKCSERGKQHALPLASYAPLDDKFKKACTFTGLKGDLDKMAGAAPKDIVNHLVALNTSRQVSNCLAAVGRSTKDETVRATAYGIRDTMAATMMAKP